MRISDKLFEIIGAVRNVISNTYGETDLPIELFIKLAEFMASDIRTFFASEQGKAYYEKWMKEHPEDMKAYRKPA